MMPRRKQFFLVDRHGRHSRIRAEFWISHLTLATIITAVLLALAVLVAVLMPDMRSQAIEILLLALQALLAQPDRTD